MKRSENLDTLRSYIIACCADGKVSAQEYNYLKKESKKAKLNEKELRDEIHIALLNMGKDKKRINDLKFCVIYTKEALKYDPNSNEAFRILNEAVNGLSEKELLDLARTTIDGFETYKTILFEKIKEKGKDFNTRVSSSNNEEIDTDSTSENRPKIEPDNKDIIERIEELQELSGFTAIDNDKDSIIHPIVLPGIFKDSVLHKKGGMSLIYTAILNDPNSRWHERKIIIKQIKPDKKDDPTYNKLFFKEYNILRNLEHANILRVIRKGEEDYGQYYISEFINGKTLNELIETDIGLTKNYGKRKRLYQIFIGLLNGIQGIHEENIIHRDLKPANIMITSTANKVKIIDFGLAKTDMYDDMIREAGTPPYISPEQRGQSHIVDNRTDIYSFGVIMLEMISGLKGKDNINLLPKNLQSLELIIRKCTEDNVDERYNYVSEIIDDLTKKEALSELKLCGSNTIDELCKKTKGNTKENNFKRIKEKPKHRAKRNLALKILIPAIVIIGAFFIYKFVPINLSHVAVSQQTASKDQKIAEVIDNTTNVNNMTVTETKDKNKENQNNSKNVNSKKNNIQSKKPIAAKWDFMQLNSYLKTIHNSSKKINFAELYQHVDTNCEVYYLINGKETGQPVDIKSFVEKINIGNDYKITPNSLKYNDKGKIIKFYQEP